MSKVYVVVNMWDGLVDDVSVHRKEPKDLTPIDEDGDNGNFIYHTEIKESDNHTDNLEQEIISALKINRDVNWIEHDANDEFDNLITFVKTLFSRYRNGSILERRK